jgi:cell division protein FtsQ
MIITQVRKHYKDFKISWKLIAKLLVFALFLSLVSFAFNQIKITHYFPIKEVKIAGLEHVDHQEVQHLLLPLVKKGFFTVDVDLIKERLMHFSWISEAYVRRIWPNQIVIQVIEKKPIARWNDASLLTTSGEIFSPAQDLSPQKLPVFIGPDGEHMQMLNHYHKITTLLQPLQFKIVKLELTPSLSWQVTLSNGIKLNMGYKDVLTRIGHFVKVYPKIVGNKSSDVEYIDLRYANGFAVRWKA